MGIEVVLGELLIVQSIATAYFARFEVETPAWRKVIKWLIISTIAVGLHFWIGSWSVIFPMVALIPGTIYHLTWCRKNGIDPLKATPKRKYYKLRGWKWEE